MKNELECEKKSKVFTVTISFPSTKSKTFTLICQIVCFYSGVELNIIQLRSMGYSEV